MSLQSSLRQRSQNRLRNVTPIRTGAEIRIKSKEDILAKQKSMQPIAQSASRQIEKLFSDSDLSSHNKNPPDSVPHKDPDDPSFKLQISLDGDHWLQHNWTEVAGDNRFIHLPDIEYEHQHVRDE